MRRQFTKYPSNYVSAADKASFSSPEEWEQSGKDFADMTPQEKEEMRQRTKERRAEWKKNPPRHKGARRFSFSNPDGTEKYQPLNSCDIMSSDECSRCMTREDILDTIEELSYSQGFYGRLLAALQDAEINRPAAYEEFMRDLEAQCFTEPVELVMYLEG